VKLGGIFKNPSEDYETVIWLLRYSFQCTLKDKHWTKKSRINLLFFFSLCSSIIFSLSNSFFKKYEKLQREQRRRRFDSDSISISVFQVRQLRIRSAKSETENNNNNNNNKGLYTTSWGSMIVCATDLYVRPGRQLLCMDPRRRQCHINVYV
jgi:hypothetical protein